MYSVNDSGYMTVVTILPYTPFLLLYVFRDENSLRVEGLKGSSKTRPLT